ncbi:hypothetical protein HK098_004205 [Nowakowskiella sp. JEL0407]|nr:hypothetical protein HK098_004205 [Nowakowskiella sp. JEL0407]
MIVSINILHFNDVYHLDPFAKEPVGGFARFSHLVNEKRQSYSIPPLVLFSGDLFNPSLESSVTKGKHMLVVNHLDIDAACYGNHDFDFGVDQLVSLAGQCNFPWLLSNVFEPNSTTPLAKGHSYLILTRENITFGIIGLVESEWLDTLAQTPPLLFQDFISTGKSLTQKLKAGEMVDKNGKNVKCDFVIALTHMRVPNDELLAEKVPEIDLILGGHDHEWFLKGGGVKHEGDVYEGDIRVLKSGCDFKDLGEIELIIQVDEHGSKSILSKKVTRNRITKEIPESPTILEEIAKATASIKSSMSKVIGITSTQWEARSTVCRLGESNVGNFAADLMRFAYDTDMAFIGGGTIRSDTTYGPGEITIRDIMEIFPFDDPCVVIKIKGADFWQALENSVSEVPKMEGRFPQVSGMKLTYDSSRPADHRIVSVSVLDKSTSQYTPIDLEKEYTVCSRAYLVEGRDGFDALKNSTVIVGEHDGLLLSTIIRRFFTSLRVVNIISHLTHSGSGSSPSTPTTLHHHRENSSESVQFIANKDHPNVFNDGEELQSVQKFAKKWHAGVGKKKGSDGGGEKIADEVPVVAPVVEGRIIDVVGS